jgi:hypothetical protein
MDRIRTCPGSYRLESKMPYEPAGEAAAIGTAIHELSEAMLRGDDLIQADYPDEQWEMAAEYVSFINNLVQNPRKRLIEVNVDAGLKSIHEALGGTADAVLVDGNHLHVIDLKTGRVAVPAKDNKQLLTYAVGVMRQFKAPESIECTMHIFQPKTGHSTWTVNGSTLLEHAKELERSAVLALSNDAPTNPSSDACRYCKAKPICPSMRQKVQDNARKDFIEIVKKSEKDDSVDVPPVTPDMIELAQLASMWSESVLESAKRQLTNGDTIQGWTMKPGRKTKFWKSDDLAMEALKDYPHAFDLKSPSAILKLGIDISAELIGEKSAAPSLTKEKQQ